MFPAPLTEQRGNINIDRFAIRSICVIIWLAPQAGKMNRFCVLIAFGSPSEQDEPILTALDFPLCLAKTKKMALSRFK